MEIQLRYVNRIAVIQIAGRFDAFQVPTVKEHIENAQRSTPNLVVDLAGVDFMDSAALAILVQGMKHSRQARGDLRVCRLQPPVKVIFELTRLDKAFSHFSSLEEAVASFR